MAIAIIRGDREFAITSGGPTQDIVVPGRPEIPKAAMIYMNSSLTPLGVNSAEAQQSIGFTDGTAQFCIGGQDQDNLATTNTVRVESASVVVCMLSADGTTTDGIATATMIPGGVRLNWSELPSQAYVIAATFWMGEGITAAIGSATPDVSGQPAVNVNVGFQPDHLVTLATENTELDDTIRDGMVLQVAHATRLLAGVNQFSAQWRSNDNSGTSNIRMRLSDVELCRTQLVGNEQTRLVSIDATGFNIDSNGGGTGPTIVYLAISYGGKGYQLKNEVAPTLLGVATYDTDDINGTPFSPSSLLGMTTSVTSAGWNASVTNDEAAFAGFQAFAGREEDGSADEDEFCSGVTIEDGVTVSNTDSRSANLTLLSLNETFQVVHYAAELFGFSTTGFALDFTTVGVANDRAFLMFALEEDPLNGQGDNLLGMMQFAGTGVVSISGSGNSDIGPLSCEGDAEQVFEGTGDKLLGPLACEGAGVQTFEASGDCEMPQFFGTGGGFQTFTGGTNPDTDEIPQIFRPMEFAGTGFVTLGLFEGGGDKLLGAMQCAGQGGATFEGSGDTQLPSMESDGVGASSFGSGDAQLPAMQPGGQGAQVFAGGGDKLLGAFKFNNFPAHEAEQVFEGAGDKPLGSMDMSSGTGAQTFTGSGDAQLPALDPEGAATMQPEGGGDAQLPSMQFGGAGEQIFAGSGDYALAAITKGEPQPSGFVIESVGGSDDTAKGTQFLPPLECAGLGGQGFAGESLAELPSLTKDGAGQLVFSGSGDFTLPAMSMAGGQGADLIFGGGDFQLPALQCAGTDKPLSGGSSIIASPDPDTPIEGST